MNKNFITTTEGESFPHVELWRCANIQYNQARQTSKGGLYFDMGAVVITFFAYEAYLNYVGERLDPGAWSDEKSFFNSKGYEGLDGKLKRLSEKCGNFKVDRGKRPYQTIRMVNKYRSTFTHGKICKYSNVKEHSADSEPDWWPKDSFDFISPDFAKLVLEDFEEFIEDIHAKFQPYTDDIFFKEKALGGISSFNHSVTNTIP